ncbi:MAG: hypothetical protein ACJAW8_002089 [Oleispira sp.]|jgi:hypothetical protein
MTPAISALRLLIVLVLTSAAPWASAGLFGSDCPETKESKKPAWVKAGFSFTDTNYRFGFGEARYFDDASYKALLKQAEQLARQDLVNSVHIEVDASSGITILVEDSEQGEEVKHRSENRIETRSKLELPGLPIHRKWQNADSCSVYVQVRISEAMIALVLKRTQAQAYLADARNDDKTVKVRLHAISEAIRLAKKHEFNKIPGSLSSAQMLREFKSLKADLQRISSRNNHVVYVINQTSASDTHALSVLRNTMKTSVAGSFETGKSCISPSMCLQQAGQTSANYASIAVVNLSTSKQNGFWVGDFNVEMTLWDLADNSRKFSSGEKSSRVMNRHKHKLTLKKGLDKWLAQHEASLQEYRQSAQKAGNK